MTIGDLLKKQAMSRKGVAAYNPTPKQCEAGNYPKLHLKIQGMNIAVENPKGSYRRGVSPDGSKWETLMKFDYAYVKGSKGVDGDEVDIFLGPKARWSPVVHVIDQVYDGKFDEHKCMLGWDTQAEAKKAYLSCYEKGWDGCGDITTMSIKAFKKWIRSDDSQKPVSNIIKEASMTVKDILQKQAGSDPKTLQHLIGKRLEGGKLNKAERKYVKDKDPSIVLRALLGFPVGTIAGAGLGALAGLPLGPVGSIYGGLTGATLGGPIGAIAEPVRASKSKAKADKKVERKTLKQILTEEYLSK